MNSAYNISSRFDEYRMPQSMIFDMKLALSVYLCLLGKFVRFVMDPFCSRFKL